MTTFVELGLSQPLLKAIAHEGYVHPTPIQAQSIPEILAGRDILGCAQTGTGKTAAFALPILNFISQSGRQPKGQRRRVRTLVLAPTRELAEQIFQSFKTYGKHTGLIPVVVYGGVNSKPQIEALREGADVLVATPGRLLDLMGQEVADLSRVEFFVLDEADRMLDMGFLPDVERIIEALPTRRQTLMFSATMPTPIVRLAEDILTDPVSIEISPEKITADQIDQSVYFVQRYQKTHLLAHLIKTRGMEKVLVFTRTKGWADRCARELQRSGIKAESLHGDKSQVFRHRILNDFKVGRCAALIATDLAARGIDVDSIGYVINFELPFEPETYVHRVGRTARAGAAGIAISFCSEDERELLTGVEKLLRYSLLVNNDHPEYPPKPERESPEGISSQPDRPKKTEGNGQGRRPARRNRGRKK